MASQRWRWAACMVLLAATPLLRADAEFDRLDKEAYDARLEYYGKARETKPGQPPPADPWIPFAPRIRAYAEAHAGKPEAIPALAWILEFTHPASETAELSPDASWALAQLTNHVADPAIKNSLHSLRSGAYWWGTTPLTPLFEKIYEANPDPNTKAEALYSRGRALYEERREPDGRVARQKQGLALLHAVIREFPHAQAADWAVPLLFEAEHLQIGMTVPAIAGVNEHGQPIKLADFKGRVVVIDFWGTWCGHCMAMLPHEREMVKRLADQPFTLLGIDCDASPAVLEQALKEQAITWPQLYDGKTGEGAIANSWNIHAFPSIFVLDHEGVIRCRDLRGPALEDAVVELLKRVPGAETRPAIQRPTTAPATQPG